MANSSATQPPIKKTRWYRQLYFWVIVAIVLGVFVGWLWPSAGKAMEPVGTTFITAMRMLIGPIIALATGLLAINLIPLGDGVHANVDEIQTTDAVNNLIQQGENQHWWDFITHIIPSSVVEPFVEGDILQIIFLAVVFGVALNAVGRIGAPLLDLVQRATKVIFKVLSYIMKLAPLGAFGAMAYAIGKYGIST